MYKKCLKIERTGLLQHITKVVGKDINAVAKGLKIYKLSCAARPGLACSEVLNASYRVTAPLLPACKNTFLLHRCRKKHLAFFLRPRKGQRADATGPRCNGREISTTCRGKGLSEEHCVQQPLCRRIHYTPV